MGPFSIFEDETIWRRCRECGARYVYDPAGCPECGMQEAKITPERYRSLEGLDRPPRDYPSPEEL